MDLIITALLWLVLEWPFWLLSVIGLIVCTESLDREKNFIFTPAVLATLILIASCFRFPVLGNFFAPEGSLSWGRVAAVLVAYLVVGVGYTLLEWVRTVRLFRRAVKEELQRTKPEHTALVKGVDSDLKQFQYRRVGNEYKGYVFLLTASEYPMSLWITYWPHYIIGKHVLKVGKRIAEQLVSVCDRIARRWAVKVPIIPEDK